MRVRSTLVVPATLLGLAFGIGCAQAQEQERRRPIVWPAEVHAIVSRHAQGEVARLTGELGNRASGLLSSAGAPGEDVGQLARALMRVRIPTALLGRSGGGSVASPSVPSGGGGGGFTAVDSSICICISARSEPPIPPR